MVKGVRGWYKQLSGRPSSLRPRCSNWRRWFGITIFLTTAQAQPCCPHCERKANKVHSRYVRQLRDLPWEGLAVRLHLSSRKWFCRNPACQQRIFCEQLPELVAPYGRKTLRLNDVLHLIGFALGGRAGSRPTQQLSLRAIARQCGMNRETVRSYVRAETFPEFRHP